MSRMGKRRFIDVTDPKDRHIVGESAWENGDAFVNIMVAIIIGLIVVIFWNR